MTFINPTVSNGTVEWVTQFPIIWKLLLNSFKERENGLEGGKSEFTSEDKTDKTLLSKGL